MPLSPDFRPAKAHAALGPDFFDLVVAADFPKHIIRHRNQRWAARVGCAGLTDDEWIAHFGRFEPLPGSFEQPMALRYHGHQFRHYNPNLGDGRGFRSRSSMIVSMAACSIWRPKAVARRRGHAPPTAG